MPRHTIMSLFLSLCILWLSGFITSSKVQASSTPEPTLTPAPTDVVVYEYICTETRPDGCPMDTSDLSLTWLLECGGDCALIRECGFVKTVNGTAVPIIDLSTVTPTPELTPTVTPPPTSTNCGQAVHLDDWVVTGRNYCNLVLAHKTSAGWTNCVGQLSGIRGVGVDIRLEFGEDNLQNISNFDMSWLGWQEANGTVTFERCRTGRPCPDNQYRLSTSWSNGQFANTEFPALVEGVYSISINVGGQPGTVANIPVDDARDYIILNDIRFCASDAIFPAETPTPTPSPTGTPEPEPTCEENPERLFRVASVPSCDLDDDLIVGWRNHDWDLIEPEIREIPEWQNCYAQSLAYYKDFHAIDRFALVAELSQEVWLSEVRIEAEPRYAEITNVDWDSMLIVLYRDGELIYELDYNHDGIHEKEYSIRIPNIRADAVGVSIPAVRWGDPAVETGIELFSLEAYGSPNLPICGAGGGIPPHCEFPDNIDYERDYTFEFKPVISGRRCRTLIPPVMAFRGLQACLTLHSFGNVNVLGVALPIVNLFHSLIAGLIIRNVLTR